MQRSHTALAILTAVGREAANFDGGYRTWQTGSAANGTGSHAPAGEPAVRALRAG